MKLSDINENFENITESEDLNEDLFGPDKEKKFPRSDAMKIIKILYRRRLEDELSAKLSP